MGLALSSVPQPQALCVYSHLQPYAPATGASLRYPHTFVSCRPFGPVIRSPLIAVGCPPFLCSDFSWLSLSTTQVSVAPFAERLHALPPTLLGVCPPSLTCYTLSLVIFRRGSPPLGLLCLGAIPLRPSCLHYARFFCAPPNSKVSALCLQGSPCSRLPRLLLSFALALPLFGTAHTCCNLWAV